MYVSAVCQLRGQKTLFRRFWDDPASTAHLGYLYRISKLTCLCEKETFPLRYLLRYRAQHLKDICPIRFKSSMQDDIAPVWSNRNALTL